MPLQNLGPENGTCILRVPYSKLRHDKADHFGRKEREQAAWHLRIGPWLLAGLGSEQEHAHHGPWREDPSEL